MQKQVEKLSFDNVFDAKLPRVKNPKMKSSVKERVQDLVNKNKTFTCSSLFMYMGTMIYNNKDVITAQKELMRRNEVIKRKAVEKVDNTKYNRFQDAMSSYKLYKYKEHKMLLADQKHISMYVLDKEGVTTPSRYNTKDTINHKLSECKIPQESYFDIHIHDEGEVVKFKAKRLRLGQYEPIYIDERNVVVNDMSGMKEITI